MSAMLDGRNNKWYVCMKRERGREGGRERVCVTPVLFLT